MSALRTPEHRNKPAQSVGKLDAEKSQDGNHDVHQDAEHKLTIPSNLTRCCAVEIAQYDIALELNQNDRGHTNKRQNNDPIEEEELIS